LISLFHGLERNRDLRVLDVSHNTFTPKVVQQLCVALEANTSLSRLIAEHCDIDFPQIQCLAKSLSAIKGLQHLELNGNEFTWSPRATGGYWQDVVLPEFEEHGSGWYRGGFEPEGITLLAQVMGDNHSLLSFEVKVPGISVKMPGRSFGMLCCSTPPYSEYYQSCTTSNKIETALKRNKEFYATNKKPRMQQAVCRLATLLLSKMEGT